jgi:hypothetical protein
VKAVAVLLAVLLVLAHPVAVAVVLGVEAPVVGALGLLIWRGLRAVGGSPEWRRTS